MSHKKLDAKAIKALKAKVIDYQGEALTPTYFKLLAEIVSEGDHKSFQGCIEAVYMQMADDEGGLLPL